MVLLLTVRFVSDIWFVYQDYEPTVLRIMSTILATIFFFLLVVILCLIGSATLRKNLNSWMLVNERIRGFRPRDGASRWEVCSFKVSRLALGFRLIPCIQSHGCRSYWQNGPLVPTLTNYKLWEFSFYSCLSSNRTVIYFYSFLKIIIILPFCTTRVTEGRLYKPCGIQVR